MLLTFRHLLSGVALTDLLSDGSGGLAEAFTPGALPDRVWYCYMDPGLAQGDSDLGAFVALS